MSFQDEAERSIAANGSEGGRGQWFITASRWIVVLVSCAVAIFGLSHSEHASGPEAGPLASAPPASDEAVLLIEVRETPVSTSPTPVPVAMMEPPSPVRYPTASDELALSDATPGVEPTATATIPPATATPTPRPLALAATPVADNPFLKLIAPLVVQAQAERRSARVNDPEYAKRIDSQLNDGRINFLTMGYGITYEPPWPPDHMGSISVFSLNLKTGVIDQITINHDVRAPEIERFLQARNPDEPKQAHKIDKADFVGGHNLLRRTVEDVTGLRIDYVVTFSDVILKNLVDLLDGITIISPYPFKSNPCFVYAGKAVPELEVTGKKQRLSGEEAVCYLKGIEIVARDAKYSKTRENAYRIPVLKRALSERFNERLFQDPLLAVKLPLWLKDAADRKEIVTNLDLVQMVPAMLSHITPADIANGFAIPPSGATVYLVHDHSGDGGLAWVDTDSSAITRKDIAAGVYTRSGQYDSTFATAAGGNPYAPSLADGYWFRCRAIVRSKLR